METREFYDRIHDSWYNIRHWTLFKKELKELNERWDGGKLLNVGCAHGADFAPFDEKFEMYGIDVSTKLLRMGQKFSEKLDSRPYLTTADMTHLPFKDNTFDNVICIASLHHLLEEEKRKGALKQIKRVLKDGNEAFITVWNKWQPQFIFKGKTIKKEWDYKGKTLERDYYLYTYPEFKKELEKTDFNVVKIGPESSYDFPLKYFSKNITALVK
ncbi:MAG: class I SAM-dependent methyltransferase [Candidatus Aenigmatarchaeota archaeon]